MKNLLQTLTSPLPNSPESNIRAIPVPQESNYFWWLLDCHGFVYNTSLIIPSTIFVAYLALKARGSFGKLTYGTRSYVVIAYYVLLWVVSLLNLLWCFFQTMQCNSANQTSWNILSLLTNSGMLFMEVSLVAFLLQGNHATGSAALKRTFIISGTIVTADMLLNAVCVFGFGVPLFDYDHETVHQVKWVLWIIHKLLLSAVYGFILFMHHSKWKETLPARPAFYNYIFAMFILSMASLLACLLGENGSGFGFWLFDLATVSYHTVYLPFLYLTFLADFFQEDDMRLENVYYSEMKDAGFFDSDWE